MKSPYWVYVNEPNNKALIHAADCSFCRNGHGTADDKLATNGHWEAAPDQASAIRIAKRAGKATTRWCGHCARRLNISARV